MASNYVGILSDIWIYQSISRGSCSIVATCWRADHGGGAALLQKALQLVVGVALRDAAARGPEFNGRPFFRIFIGLFSELPAGPGAAETAELPYLVCAFSA